MSAQNKVQCLNQIASLKLTDSDAAKYFSEGSVLSENGYALLAAKQVEFFSKM